MVIDVVLSSRQLFPDSVRGKRAVVIDVLRATSVIVYSLEQGAASVTPCRTADEARYVASTEPGEWLLCGEQSTFKIDGFDLGNSPREYTAQAVEGKNLALVTTNGTQIFREAHMADEIIIASLRNCGAVAEFLGGGAGDIVFICAGSAGAVGNEDVLCAGLIIQALLTGTTSAVMTDSSRIAARCAAGSVSAMREFYRSSSHAGLLIANGFEDDVEFCGEIDRSAIVPVARGNQIFIY